MKSAESTRIDKFLWSVRIFKTRSSASDSCRNGKVMLGNQPVKPSRIVLPGETITFRKAPVTLTYRILAIPPSRVPAKLVQDYIEDLTPESEKLKLIVRPGELVAFREKGTGRPTKKERRLIDRLREDSGLG